MVEGAHAESLTSPQSRRLADARDAISDRIPARSFRVTWLLGLISLMFLALVSSTLGPSFYLKPGAVTILTYQALTQDVVGLLILLAALPVSWLLARRALTLPLPSAICEPGDRLILAAAAFALLASGAGAVFFMRGFALSMDEFSTWFQARIFLNGDLLAEIDEEWREFAKALQPAFIAIKSDLWGSGYRPVNALLLAGFELAGVGIFMNAVFAALSVWLIAAIAGKLWPEERRAPVLAAALLSLSPQFIVTAMTPYAMTGHLLASLLWLWLFLRDRFWSHALAVLVGIAAMGLHQIHIHPLVALPFIAWLGWRRRWGTAAAYCGFYGLAFLLWSNWWHLSQMVEAVQTAPVIGTGAGGLTKVAGRLVMREPLLDVIAWPINLGRFLSWQTLALVPLLIVAWNLRRNAPAMIHLLFWSAASLLAIHVVLMPAQGHGWGYRYLHPVLGHFPLLALYGWFRFREAVPQTVSRRFGRGLIILGGVTVAIMLPLRFAQVATTVWPVERSVRTIQSLDADIILVDGDDIHIGRDLVRNDPYLSNIPKLMYVQRLNSARLKELCSRYRVRLVGYSDIRAAGMPELPDSLRNDGKRREKLDARLRAAGCIAG